MEYSIGRGCDGIVDLKRIISDARAFADAEVYCFQEISSGFTGLDGGVDQAAALAAMMPGHRPIFYPAVDSSDDTGKRRCFGNATFSRLPVLRIENHLLPWPTTVPVRSMRRQALEVTVRSTFGPLRITNTHLKFHSGDHREVQIERLLDLQQDASTRAKAVVVEDKEPYASQVVEPSGILCGDFNFDSSDAQHAKLGNPSRPGLNYRDAWSICYPGRPHLPTCGIYDRKQWPNGEDCRDFIFVTEDLAGRVRRIAVDSKTAASDHQPVLIELADQA
jgi:endonuclease/exonuclease/phosphatase family metal-dependent hydrolase